MDITRDRETDTLIKSAIGNALRQLRQHKGLSLADAAQLTGKTPEKLSEIEDGNKVINLPHFFQFVATYEGQVTIKSKDLSIEIEGIKPFTSEQLKAICNQRNETSRHNAALHNLERMFDTHPDPNNDTPPTKKRRPRLANPNK